MIVDTINDVISIIIPAYNAEKHLDQCLESVVGQTYRDLEIILVDDKSTDKTGEMADSWARGDSRINVVHNEKNMGVAYSRNVGIKIARGRYIGFVDSDDFIHCDFYERMHSLIVQYDADISICNEAAFADGKEDPAFDNTPLGEITEEDHQQYIEHFMDGFTGHIGWNWNKLYRADYLKKIQFREYAYEDIVFNSEYAAFIKKAVWTRDRMYAYRISGESLTGAGRRNPSAPAAESFIATRLFLADNPKEFTDRYQMYVLGKVANLYANCQKHFGKEAAGEVYDIFLKEYENRNCKCGCVKNAIKMWLARHIPFTYCAMATRDVL